MLQWLNKRTKRKFWNGFPTRREIDDFKAEVIGELSKIHTAIDDQDMSLHDHENFKLAQGAFNKVTMSKLGITNTTETEAKTGNAYN